MKKLLVAMALVAFVATSAYAADKKTAAKAPASPAAVQAKKPNFSMIAGTLTSIDASDPNNIKIQVKNDADGAVRSVTLTPWTNITKVTDASELKTGETVRMMTRKVDDKEVAMGVMFGKVKNMPVPPPAKAPNVPATTAPTVKK